MVACSHGASLLVFNSRPRDYNSLYSHEIASWTLEEKFQIIRCLSKETPPCDNKGSLMKTNTERMSLTRKYFQPRETLSFPLHKLYTKALNIQWHSYACINQKGPTYSVWNFFKISRGRLDFYGQGKLHFFLFALRNVALFCGFES